MTTLFEQIEALNQEAQTLQAEADEFSTSARQRLEERNAKLAAMRDLANQAAGDFQLEASQLSPAASTKTTTPPPAAHGNASTSAKAKPKPQNGRRRRGRASNQTPLREVVWDVVDRESWKDVGPTVPEVVKVINQEGKWTSDTKTADRQIQNAVYGFRNEGKFARVSGKDGKTRYYVVKGATINGPKLDESGNPINE